MSEPDLHGLPDWVKSFGLPAEAAAAIDRWWTPVWEALRDELGLLPEHPRRAPTTPVAAGVEQIEFEAVEELEPGAGWKARFDAMWPTYRAWYLRDGEQDRPDLLSCRTALARHMPELVPTYGRLSSWPAATSSPRGCSRCTGRRASWPAAHRTRGRAGRRCSCGNYDYPASRLEGIVCITAWTGRRVIGMSDCLWGLLDGINDAGLAVSLTFGGRREVGDGFAIPLVVRYVLETCATAAEAGNALARIPVHAAQNVTVLDASGAFLTAYVGPGREPKLEAVAATTNHQGTVDWPEYAHAIRSVEREHRVVDLLADPALDRDRFIDALLQPPLHSTEHGRGFGTIYTAAYFPADGRVEYRWPSAIWRQSFDEFRESRHTATFAGEPRATTGSTSSNASND